MIESIHPGEDAYIGHVLTRNVKDRFSRDMAFRATSLMVFNP